MALSALYGARTRVAELVASVAGPSSRGLHASAVVGKESARRATARRKRNKVLNLRVTQAAESEASAAHPVLGSPMNAPGGPSSLYEGSRLQKAVLRPEALWYSAPPNYAAGGEPAHYVGGLGEADKELLFGAVPLASAALAFDPERPVVSAAQAGEQAKQTEAMRRILDLRNADKQGIELVNRQRIIEEFGKNPHDTGNTVVQAALITHKIRSLWEHVEANKRDIHNRRALRLLVHKRARVFKFLKRTEPLRYLDTLSDLGLCPQAVEGEIKVGM